MSFSYYLQVVTSLAILGGTLFFLTKFSKKLQKKRFSGDVKILDRCSLDSNNTLVIAEIRGQQYLFGVSSKGIDLLEKLHRFSAGQNNHKRQHQPRPRHFQRSVSDAPKNVTP